MTASAPAASSTGLPLPAPTRNQRTSLRPSATPSTSGQSPRTYPIGEQSGGGGGGGAPNLPGPPSDTNRPDRKNAAPAPPALRPPEGDSAARAGARRPLAGSRQ